MTAPALLLGARLGAARFDAVVDRIEGPMAVLEVSPVTVVDVPVALLPCPIREGDRLRVRVGRRHLRVRVRPAPAPPGAPDPRASSSRTCAHPQGE